MEVVLKREHVGVQLYATSQALPDPALHMQMASTLGRQGQLLALLCQPAEVQGCVPIPAHARVWGVDSGVRHSVGGSDYGAVRVGAFMGLAVAHAEAKRAAADTPSSSASPAGSSGSPLGQALAGGHLVHVAPSLYQSALAQALPEELGGQEFLERYGPHLDSVTSVDPAKRWGGWW